MSDEFDKTCTLVTTDAKVGVSFAGLAKAVKYHAHVHLLESIEASAAPDFQLIQLMQRLTTRLNADFLQHPAIRNIPRYRRMFSVLFVGFRYYANTSHPVFGLISNFEDPDEDTIVDVPWPEFRPFLYEIPATMNAHMVVIGNISGLDMEAAMALRQVAHILPARSANAKLVHLIQQASRSPLSGNTVGGQCTSIVIPAAANASSETMYRVMQPQRTLYFPAAVRAFPPAAAHMHNLTIGPEDPNGPYMVVPQVNRNKLCPCGSLRRYKHCHRARKGRKKTKMSYHAGTS